MNGRVCLHVGYGHPLMKDSIESHADCILEVIKVLCTELISGEGFKVGLCKGRVIN